MFFTVYVTDSLNISHIAWHIKLHVKLILHVILHDIINRLKYTVKNFVFVLKTVFVKIFVLNF